MNDKELAAHLRKLADELERRKASKGLAIRLRREAESFDPDLFFRIESKGKHCQKCDRTIEYWEAPDETPCQCQRPDPL